MSYNLSTLIVYKNPNKLLKECKENKFHYDLYSNPNSELWEALISYYYYKYEKYQKKQLDLKDFYVFMYYCEELNILKDYNLIIRGQKVLLLLPKIYDGDHMSVIHSISNLAIRGNFCNLVLYRDQTEKNLPIYGNGYLMIQYLKSDKDVYIKKEAVSNYSYAEHVHPFYGGYNKFVN